MPGTSRHAEGEAGDHRRRADQGDPDPEPEAEQAAFGAESDCSGSSADIDDRHERDDDPGGLRTPPIRAWYPLRNGGEHEQQRSQRPQAQCPADRAIWSGAHADRHVPALAQLGNGAAIELRDLRSRRTARLLTRWRDRLGTAPVAVGSAVARARRRCARGTRHGSADTSRPGRRPVHGDRLCRRNCRCSPIGARRPLFRLRFGIWITLIGTATMVTGLALGVDEMCQAQVVTASH